MASNFRIPEMIKIKGCKIEFIIINKALKIQSISVKIKENF